MPDRSESALRLWQGEPLAGLDGLWISGVREAWRRERLDAMVARAGAAFAARGSDHVIAPASVMLAEAHCVNLWRRS